MVTRPSQIIAPVPSVHCVPTWIESEPGVLVETLKAVQYNCNFCALTGPFPQEFFNVLPSLEITYWDGNGFTGPLPASIVNASKLTRVRLVRSLWQKSAYLRNVSAGLYSDCPPIPYFNVERTRVRRFSPRFYGKKWLFGCLKSNASGRRSRSTSISSRGRSQPGFVKSQRGRAQRARPTPHTTAGSDRTPTSPSIR